MRGVVPAFLRVARSKQAAAQAARPSFASASPSTRIPWDPASLLSGKSPASLMSSGTSFGSSAVWGASIRVAPEHLGGGPSAPYAYAPDSDSDSALDELLLLDALGSPSSSLASAAPFAELDLDDHVETFAAGSATVEAEDGRSRRRGSTSRRRRLQQQRRGSASSPAAGSSSASAACHTAESSGSAACANAPRAAKPSSSSSNAPSAITVDIPEDTVSRFMHHASDNTDRSVETSAVLAGRWSEPDAAGVKRLELAGCIIPEQVGTENTTEITSDGETSYGELLFSEDLISLGWIHTHPTQDCFLSSVDLHSTLGFQSALPQALAMVCAPSKERSVGIFRLTPSGMKTLSSCSERGFHVHPGSSADHPLYHEAMGVRRNPDIMCKIFDLR